MHVPQTPILRDAPGRDRKQAMTVWMLRQLLAKMPDAAQVYFEHTFDRGVSIVKGGKLQSEIRFVGVEHTPFGDSVQLSGSQEPKIITTEGISSQRGRT